jgi:error-prone DNA polymerase
MVRGLGEDAAKRIVEARMRRPLESVDDLAHRAGLDRRDLKCLAAADALAPLAGHRREAHWSVAGTDTGRHILAGAPVEESRPELAPPTEGESLLADYASTGLTLGRHPLALLRPRLSRMRFVTAEELKRLPSGARARAAGIVIGRQRPGTASGTVFVTLEDETGCVNVIVWPHLIEAQRRELLGSRLMGVDGTLEREGEVMHLIAKRLVDHSDLIGSLQVESRDFH